MLRDRIAVLFFGDVIALFASFAGMALIRFTWANEEVYLHNQLHTFLLLFTLWLVVFFIFDLYNVRRVNPNPRNIGFLALAVFTASILCVLYFYIFPLNGTPKTNLAIVAGFAFLFLMVWRRIFYYLFSSRFSQRIAVIGTGPSVVVLIEDITKHSHIGKIIHAHETYDGIERLPDIDLIISHGIPLDRVFEVSRGKNCDVLSLLEAYQELFGKVPLALMTEEKAMGVFSKQKNIAYRVIERLVEITFSLIVLLAASPVLIIAMLAILIEDGRPLFIRQSRVGKNGKPFLLYKLRTMKALASDGSAEINGIQWAGEKDPRITKVGKILRKTHIDEAIQMLNVLKGDIALIGPRPERPEFVEKLEQTIPYYFLRHTVKPGFTGWAQIKYRYARSELDSREKFEYDLYWLFRRNVLLDLGIFVKTIQIIFTH